MIWASLTFLARRNSSFVGYQRHTSPALKSMARDERRFLVSVCMRLPECYICWYDLFRDHLWLFGFFDVRHGSKLLTNLAFQYIFTVLQRGGLFTEYALYLLVFLCRKGNRRSGDWDGQHASLGIQHRLVKWWVLPNFFGVVFCPNSTLRP